MDDDNLNQTQKENDEFKTNEKLVDIYVCII